MTCPIAVVPDTNPDTHKAMTEAVLSGGGHIAPLAKAEAIMWADPGAAARFPGIIAQAPKVRWIQLPFAGIETFGPYLDARYTWTSGKGVFATCVAEHVIASALAGFRGMIHYARQSEWTGDYGRNLFGSKVTVIGAGGITRELARLLEPWQVELTVVRRKAEPFEGATRTLRLEDLASALPTTDLLVVACALTEQTTGIINRTVLAALPSNAWLVNIGRGRHVVTADLAMALAEGEIEGAVLDVTDPEPLPTNHPLWQEPRCLITPHVGNTDDMAIPLIANLVRENVGRFIAGERLASLVDVDAGY